MWRYVFWYKITCVSEGRAAIFFREEIIVGCLYKIIHILGIKGKGKFRPRRLREGVEV